MILFLKVVVRGHGSEGGVMESNICHAKPFEGMDKMCRQILNLYGVGVAPSLPWSKAVGG